MDACSNHIFSLWVFKIFNQSGIHLFFFNDTNCLSFFNFLLSSRLFISLAALNMDACEARGIAELFLHLKTLNSLTAETGSRICHVYRDTSWNNIIIHQPLKVVKERNEESINIDLYCYKTTISRLDKIEPVTVGHIPRIILRYIFYFCRSVDQ